MIAHSTLLADWLVTLPTILALGGAALLLVLRRWPVLQGYLCGAILAGILVGSWLLVQRLLASGPVAMTMGGWQPPFGISFVADAFGAGFALMAAFVAFGAWLAMLATVPERAVRNGIYSLVLLLLAGVSGAVLTGDLFNLYVWFEVMLIAAFGLIALAGGPLQLDGALKYGVVNLIGTTLFLLALGLFYGLVGTLNMADIVDAARTSDPLQLSAVTGILVFALAIKAAVFPLGTWLPASYHTPPATITALVGALVTKVGVYALLRVLIMLVPGMLIVLAPSLTAFAIATMLFGPIAAIAERNFRRAVGFLLIGGVGVALSCVGEVNPTAVAGAVAYVLHAALTLGALYLLAGVLEQVASPAASDGMRGLYAARPILSLLLLALVLALAGVPPFLGFWPKLLLLQGYLQSGNWLLVFAVLANALLTLIAGARLWSRISWGPRTEIAAGRGYGGAILLACAVLLLGLAPGLLAQIGLAGGRGLVDPTAYIAAVGLAP